MISNYDKRFLMAILIVIGVFAYIFFGKPYNDMVLGALLTTGFANIVSFFFGSSDKKGKDDQGTKPPAPVVKPDGL